MIRIEPLSAGPVLRLPEVDGPPLERALAEGERRRLEVAAVEVAAALPELDLDGWRGSAQPPQPDLITWRGPTLPTQITDRVVLPADGPVADRGPGALLGALVVGGGTQIHEIGRLVPDVARVADALASVLGAQVSLSLVLGGPRGRSVGGGELDELAIVVEGAGEARLHTVLDDEPVGEDGTRSAQPAWSGRVMPGEVLLLPRSWRWELLHDEPIAWLRLGVRRQRRAEVAEQIARWSTVNPAFRTALPAGQPALADPRSPFAPGSSPEQLIAELDLPALARSARARWLASLTSAQQDALGALQQAWSESRWRRGGPGPMVVVGDVEAEFATVAWRGAQVRIPGDLVLALADPSFQGPVPLELVRAGLVDPVTR